GANFAYPTPASATTDSLALPMRPLLVTRNPVSNYIQQLYNNGAGGSYTSNLNASYASSDPLLPSYMLPYGANTAASNPHFRGVWNSSPNPAYGLGDIVIYPGPSATYSGPNYTFMATAAPGATLPATMTNGVITAVATPGSFSLGRGTPSKPTSTR